MTIFTPRAGYSGAAIGAPISNVSRFSTGRLLPLLYQDCSNNRTSRVIGMLRPTILRSYVQFRRKRGKSPKHVGQESLASAYSVFPIRLPRYSIPHVAMIRASAIFSLSYKVAQELPFNSVNSRPGSCDLLWVTPLGIPRPHVGTCGLPLNFVYCIEMRGLNFLRFVIEPCEYSVPGSVIGPSSSITQN